MRNFEIPKMNISMFETENVVTVVSGTPLTNEQEVQNELVAAITNGGTGEGREATQNIFKFAY